MTDTTTPIDATLMGQLFPNKTEEERNAWLGVLDDNEFETLEDLEMLTPENWNKLGLPLIVQQGLEKATEANKKQNNNENQERQDSVTGNEEPDPLALTSEPPPAPPVTQVDVIVIDISLSMRQKLPFDNLMTREDLSKMLFHTLVDKLVGLELNHAVGLLAFGQNLTPIPITREYERFHDHLGRLDASEGRTKLYDAVFAAAETINEYAENLVNEGAPPVIKRVFVLTDGQDNASERQAWEVARFLQDSEIVLDCIPVGGPNPALHCLSRATKRGLCVDAVSHTQSMALFQREGLLHVASREEENEENDNNDNDDDNDEGEEADDDTVGLITCQKDFNNLYSLASHSAPVLDVQSAVPKAAFAPVLSSADLAKKYAAATAGSDSSSATAPKSKLTGGGAARRILKEHKDFERDPPDNFGVHVSADDIHDWKAVLNGPAGTPYEGGVWLLTVRFPSDYPFKPMKIRFVTKIYHCNINDDGGLCLDILKDNWSPALTITKVLLSIESLLTDPNPDDPLDAFKGQMCRDNRPKYDRLAREHTERHAADDFDALAAQYNLA